MDCTHTDLPYADTGYFSSGVSAYIAQDKELTPFFQFPVTAAGMSDAIAHRSAVPVDRQLLVNTLRQQYAALPRLDAVERNLDLLLRETTFTVCTAHQPAIFTGNLFFVYKILHAIRLAASLKKSDPARDFVPVFYMGSEDADLDELGNIFLNGEKISWDTRQRGAIGRMNTKGLEKIIDRIDGELSVLPFGAELVALLKGCYLGNTDIQTATLKLVHHLFAEYGLIVLIPDQTAFKAKVIPVFEDELLNQTSSKMVAATLKKFPASLKIQAHPRDINLFYLRDDIRERIEKRGEQWVVVDSDISFTRDQMIAELKEYPERFSPNVILRGILQETILPNVAFIGGGGELAYWLELKELFVHYGVFFPVLVVRNSFLVATRRVQEKLAALQLPLTGMFRKEKDLINELVKRDSGKQLSLKTEIEGMRVAYDHLRQVSAHVDNTLVGHVEALRVRNIKSLETLEKKMLKAEKRSFGDQSRQLSAIRKELFPNDGLQERVENFMPFYARWGQEFIRMIYDQSLTTEQLFRIIEVNKS